MKNEALRLFLAVTAIIITALLTNPIFEEGDQTVATISANENKERSIAQTQKKKSNKDGKQKSTSNRTYTYFWKR